MRAHVEAQVRAPPRAPVPPPGAYVLLTPSNRIAHSSATRRTLAPGPTPATPRGRCSTARVRRCPLRSHHAPGGHTTEPVVLVGLRPAQLGRHHRGARPARLADAPGRRRSRSSSRCRSPRSPTCGRASPRPSSARPACSTRSPRWRCSRCSRRSRASAGRRCSSGWSRTRCSCWSATSSSGCRASTRRSRDAARGMGYGPHAAARAGRAAAGAAEHRRRRARRDRLDRRAGDGRASSSGTAGSGS